jgi:pilus assembly protein Flp/PilA
MVEMARMSTFFSDTKHSVGRFFADERGTTAIEYGLIASGIAAAIISIVFGVGSTVTNSLYAKVNSGLQ